MAAVAHQAGAKLLREKIKTSRETKGEIIAALKSA